MGGEGGVEEKKGNFNIILSFQGPSLQGQHRLPDANHLEGEFLCTVQGIPARVDSNGAVEFDLLVVL